jgi:Ca2+-binding RTX toxin-like protein
MLFVLTPLVLDLDGNGIQFMSKDEGVMFDMNNDGVLDKTSWVAGHDGFLAIDRNGDGVVNNQSELFGNDQTHADGFANLAQYDSNHDGVIDAHDAAFSQLKIWQDANHDGVSTADEMFDLGHYGIDSISLAATQGGEGNADVQIASTSTFHYANGQTGTIVDALFSVTDGVHGNDGAVMNGTVHNDIIQGTELNDVIAGGAGDDVLYGNGGADTFRFTGGADQGVDVIKDFNVAQGDVLDISDVLAGHDPLTDSLHNYVNLVQDGANTVVQIDATGSGTFHTIAVLEGVHVDLDTLTHNGNLIA